MGEKLQTTKSIRVWILGASLFATIFLALSAKFDTWAMKTYIDHGTNEENTTFIGLWNKCLDQRPGNNATQPEFPMTEVCEAYGDGSLGGIEGTPVFIKITRVFLVINIVVMGITTIVAALMMALTKKYLMHVVAPPAFLGSIIGLVVLITFMAPLNHKDEYEDYTMAWGCYYFLIGWFWTMSAFFAALTDRTKYPATYA